MSNAGWFGLGAFLVGTVVFPVLAVVASVLLWTGASDAARWFYPFAAVVGAAVAVAGFRFIG